MMGLGMTELVVVLVIVLLVFGGSKISGVGRSLGEAITEFKDAVKPEDKESETKAASGSDGYNDNNGASHSTGSGADDEPVASSKAEDADK